MFAGKHSRRRHQRSGCEPGGQWRDGDHRQRHRVHSLHTKSGATINQVNYTCNNRRARRCEQCGPAAAAADSCIGPASAALSTEPSPIRSWPIRRTTAAITRRSVCRRVGHQRDDGSPLFDAARFDRFLCRGDLEPPQRGRRHRLGRESGKTFTPARFSTG